MPLDEWIADPEGRAAVLIRSLPGHWENLTNIDLRALNNARESLLVMLRMALDEHEHLRLEVFGDPPRRGTFGDLATPDGVDGGAARLRAGGGPDAVRAGGMGGAVGPRALSRRRRAGSA